MFLLRRIFFIVFTLCSIAAAIIGYWYLKQSKHPTTMAIDVIPDSCLFLVSTTNFDEAITKLTRQNLLWNEFVSSEDIGILNKELQLFDSLLTDNVDLKNSVDNVPLYISGYWKNNQLQILIAFNLKQVSDEATLNSSFFEKCYNTSTQENIQQFAINKDSKRWYMSIDNGVVTVASDEPILKQIKEPTYHKLTQNTYYKELQKINSDEELLKVYVHEEFFNLYLSNKGITLPHSLGNSSLMTVDLLPNSISLNGISLIDSLSFFSALKNQTPNYFEEQRYLPYQTKAFSFLGFNNFKQVQTHLFNSNSFNDKERMYSVSFWKRASDSAMYTIKDEFYTNVDSKLIYANVKMLGYSDTANYTVALMNVKDTSICLNALKVMSDSVTLLHGKKGYFFNEQGDLFKAMFGHLYTANFKLCVVYDSYLLFFEDTEKANLYLQSILNNSTLDYHPDFKKYYSDNLKIESNYLYYTLLSENKAALQTIFSKKETASLFKKTESFSYRVTGKNNYLDFRVHVNYKQEESSTSQPILWSFKADTVINTSPYLFLNHTTNEQELVFQDAKKALYLLNATGNIVWKKQINEAIRSDIYVVDSYKNNKYQLLFNTDNYIHLIDRNGNYVNGFPVKLISTATNKLTVLDYETTKEYRLFIACDNNTIYNYKINGQLNEGFTNVSTQTHVTLPIKYMKVTSSDYLITADTKGRLYVFSRKGEGRIDLKNKLPEVCNDFYLDIGSSIKNTYIISLSNVGGLQKISLEDKQETIDLNKSYEQGKLSYQFVDDDKKMDILLMKQNEFGIYDLLGHSIMNYSVSNRTISQAKFIQGTDKSYFIVYDKENHHIEQITVDGIKHKEFTGATEFPLIGDLFKDGRNYLLSVESDQLKCLPIN